MRSYLSQAELVLRGAVSSDRPVLVRRLMVMVFVCGCFYGAVMGTHGGIVGERLLQVVYSAVKVPMLLGVTFLLCLPSFFILNTLLGVRNDFLDVLRALVTSQAGLTIVLAALAPYTVLWYASSTGYQEATVFNAVMFATASIAAQVLLWRGYRPLLARHGAHRWLLGIWLFLYVAVGIQMGWVLRPFIGDPNVRVQFFRDETWGNAYVIVARLIWDLLRR